ncbi:Predicted kinase, aminoglycoside phosphotransferase (APT) family [Massilia sp. PDC64]|nr:phosphotransferase family protein [Massilia sp. PDC64]SDD61899.1 Predicted kinase, aminoglycoside phosphotransferase (APT) family [Massilia sp. PDC64]
MSAAASHAAWGAALDLHALARWMDVLGLGEGPVGSATPLTGGTQNILLRFRRAVGAEYVLRCPRPEAGPDVRRGFLREARVLRALACSAVPHAALIASCDDDAVLGVPFYLMMPVDGFTATPHPLPPPYAGDAAWRRQMGLAMVDGLLRLGEIDPREAGLADFGKPDGFLERQVPRWLRHLDDCRHYAGWPGPHALPGLDDVAQWLRERVPARFTPGILHGDYHLGNVMFRRDSPRLAAIIDWELATVGDPLLDLGWLVATWPDAQGRGAGTIRIAPAAGLAAPAKLVERYGAGSRRDLGAIDWYVALARFKLAIMLEASHARACAGQAARATGDAHHASAVRLLEQAREAIEAGHA